MKLGALASLIIGCGLCAQMMRAQEVRYVDASNPRTQLRYPPPPPAKCDGKGHCVVVGSVGGGIGLDCGVGAREPRALRASLLWLNFDTYKVGDKIAFEVKVENSGSVPMILAASPHLADLQPADPIEPFDYEELGITIDLRSDTLYVMGPSIRLFGSASDPQSLVTLNPGEWLRVRGEKEFIAPAGTQSSESVAPFTAAARVWVHKIHFTATPGKSSMLAQGVCPREDRGTTLSVRLFIAKAEK